ncbi:MAG TPA: caspase family protein [Acidimicrobiales bacterium]|nr:caspase family protein [Acidimicrobiales bacterium]
MRCRFTWFAAGLLALVLAVPFVQARAGSPAQAATPGPTAQSDRWALVVGVTDYAGRTASTAAGAADAADFREALLRNGFPSDHILTLTERQATGAGIRSGLRWLVDHSSPNAFSVFHYSGHVKQLSGDRDHDGEKVDEYLWGSDNVLLADAELADAARSLRGLAWVDIAGCEGAGFDDGISAPNRLFTASSRETEKSYEHPGWNNSVFTGLEIDQAFLQGMGDGDGNGKVSIQEAFAFASDRAPQVTARQRRGAQHPVGAGGDGPEWFLDGPPPPPPPPPSPPPASEPSPEGPSCSTVICWG